jgi:hypothetical protein
VPDTVSAPCLQATVTCYATHIHALQQAQLGVQHAVALDPADMADAMRENVRWAIKFLSVPATEGQLLMSDVWMC